MGSGWRGGRSDLGRAHRRRLPVMAPFQTPGQILGQASWKAGSRRTAPIGFLLLVFLGKGGGVSATRQGEGNPLGRRNRAPLAGRGKRARRRGQHR